MSKPVDIECIIGNKYHSLTVLERGPIIKEKSTVTCRCDCGVIKNIAYGNLVRGLSKTCGCSHTEKGTKNVKHGLRHHPLYGIFMEMKKRCYNKKAQNYEYYGGKGIVICKEWLSDFRLFYNWSLENGWVKGLEPDRDNNNGNYEPGNVVWRSHMHNIWNNSRTKLIEYNGKEFSLNEWSKIVKIPYTTLKSRLNNAWAVDKAFTTPSNKSNRLC
jgi:hypothetical protein